MKRFGLECLYKGSITRLDQKAKFCVPFTTMTNLPYIADAIFSRPPQPPHTIRLGLAENSDPVDPDVDIEFEIISNLAVLGIKKLWGDLHFTQLDQRQFERLQEYIASVGYKLVVTCNDTNKSPWELVEDNVPITRYAVAVARLPV